MSLGTAEQRNRSINRQQQPIAASGNPSMRAPSNGQLNQLRVKKKNTGSLNRNLQNPLALNLQSQSMQSRAEVTSSVEVGSVQGHNRLTQLTDGSPGQVEESKLQGAQTMIDTRRASLNQASDQAPKPESARDSLGSLANSFKFNPAVMERNQL